MDEPNTTPDAPGFDDPSGSSIDFSGIAASLRTKILQIPERPGVYMMKDARDHIIYIGKAKVLRNRVRSYFSGRVDRPKTARLVHEIRDFDCIITSSELEALILEATLIKKWQPRFNIRIKDDKSFPYLRITTHETFPRIEVVRRFNKQDKGMFFGPYVPSKAVYSTLGLIKRVFQMAQCDLDLEKVYERPCLYYQMGQCSAPCTRYVGEQEYRHVVKQVTQFLSGRREDLVKDIETQMWQAAEEENFERAARMRDKIQAVEKVVERQKIISSKFEEQDVIAVQLNGPKAVVQVFHVREGKVMGKTQQTVKILNEETPEEILEAFVTQFYRRDTIIPREIVLEYAIDDAEVLAQWLSDRRGSKVKFTVPQRGRKAALVELVSENIAQAMNFHFDQKAEEQAAALQIQEVLGLNDPPTRIECFDISNIMGVLPVASMTVWADGKLDRSKYRHFKIKGKETPDDYEMLHEALTRRFTGSLASREDVPDLLVMDGGKGQLNVAVRALEETGFKHIPVIGIAKGPERKRDDVYIPNRKNPMNFNRHQAGLFLLARLRDEAHRFAIEYHRKLRDQANTHSILDEIPGIGPKRKRLLLKHFGSLKRVREASESELAALDGIDPPTARKIHDILHHEGWSQLGEDEQPF